jgi:predicted site-specific integrase-resolvase
MKDISRPLISYKKWAGTIGISPVTAYRWRLRGWISVINIAGKLYLTSEEIERFNQRAASGEFAKNSNLSASKVA